MQRVCTGTPVHYEQTMGEQESRPRQVAVEHQKERHGCQCREVGPGKYCLPRH